MFCTNNPMTRGEAAGFISRGFQYPAASKDYFSDDNGGRQRGVHQPDRRGGPDPRL